ncbi:hypothetical protein SteCoe_4306 [Stentor coeruleus]|uniref:SEC7 domain-containing protein n=1 Tax=Stentor coeruleus TaxID=5963 RepID=A0A1R2CV18_9CILI|nr:hypothetical protein SteCoe_4306 [Stentor coeruleus]
MEYLKDPNSAYIELLSSAFDKISKTLTNKKNKDLRDLCLSTIDLVKNDSTLDANKYFPIFKSALDLKITKVLEITLYYIQKLISHGFLTGNSEDTCSYSEPLQNPSSRHPRKMIDAIIESVCKCVQETDDNVQLQVIKTLLTTITSFNCEVHDRTLLEAFRACYHIHITSKNLVNQTTAKAILTQMMHYIFQRMENNSIPLSEEPIILMTKTLVKKLIDNVALYENKLKENQVKIILYEKLNNEERNELVDYVDKTNDEGFNCGVYGWCVLCRKGANLCCKDINDPICSESCEKAHIKNIEAAERCLIGDEGNDYLQDALVIFRSICKLSLKEFPSLMPSVTFKSKVLSLELILGVIDNPGPTFSSRKLFMDIIQGTLCESLLANSVSTEKTIFALSLSIFVALVNNFKDSLKTEIGIFLEHIFIKILESENSNYHQKLLVVEVFFNITQNPRTTLELFLNYDCDVEEKDIFARIIGILGKIAVGRNKNESSTQPQQEIILKQTSLETLMSIVTTQAAWLDNQSNYIKTDHFNEEQDDSTSDLGLENVLVEFGKNKHLKMNLSKAVAKFNIKPALGIKFLHEAGHLNSNNPAEIAVFLKMTPGIDKTVLGEFFGSRKEPNLSIFHEFVQLLDFKGVGIVEAIRMFLSSFRLPGEGQVVDRIMQKFASQYYKDNPSFFEEADTVYVLSFAIIMLQTDLHNASIQKKMPLAQFQIMNAGINKGKDLDPEYLESIYETVKNNKFTLEEDEEAREKIESSGKKKHELYIKETEKMLQKGQKLIKEVKHTSVYYQALHIDHLKIMLEALWHPLLATFSIILEEATEAKFWKLSLQGFLSCIKIACRFSMTLELEIFLSSLAKFTSLIYLNNQISEKNIECMKALLEIAKFEANYLKGSWLHVLKCLSKLDHLHLISSGAQYDGPVTENDIISSESISIQITPGDIDYIFNMSFGLDDDTIIEFVTRLIEISREELWGQHPRTFCLQALVNVADVNMNRMRYVWSRVWKTLRDHFSQAGLHKSQFIASFAIDSLKQLAIKFLQKEELENFHFQKGFLQPFEVIMKNSQNVSVKELVVACMSTFVFTVGHNIKSGWGTIIEVLLISSKETSTCIIEQAFNAIQRICEKHLHNVLEYSDSICSCLSSFVEGSFEQISIKSLEVMAKVCIDFIKVPGNYWKILLSGIGKVTKDSRAYVRNAGTTLLFSTLSLGNFDENQLKTAYSEIFLEIFEGFKADSYEKEWINLTCSQSLTGMSNLIGQKFDILYPIIPNFFSLLLSGVFTLNEHLAKTILHIFKQFVIGNCLSFNDFLWEETVKSLKKLIETCMPNELFLELKNGKLPFEPRPVSDKIMILHHIILAVKEILLIDIPETIMLSLIPSFEDIYIHARNFDANLDTRKALWTAGFMAGNKTLPGLFRIEKESLIVLLELINKTEDQKKIYHIAKELLVDVANKDKLFSGRKEEITSLESVVSKNLIPFLGKNVLEAIKNVGNELYDMVTVQDISIREELKKLIKLSLSRIFDNHASLA